MSQQVQKPKNDSSSYKLNNAMSKVSPQNRKGKNVVADTTLRKRPSPRIVEYYETLTLPLNDTGINLRTSC
ncbi:MAG: hypothetical protein Phog2KO_48490 [Phototrophicaceae bacterium]